MPSLAAALRRSLCEHADAEVAAGQEAYVHRVQPFHGVKTPLRRRLLRESLGGRTPSGPAAWRDEIEALWHGRYREERYLALDLAARFPRWHQDALPLFESMLPEADWWDVLDPLATDLLGSALRERPRLLAARVHAWRRSEHLWTRRASLLVQLKYRGETDTDLLAKTILLLAAEQEFFIRKAIGWALREYSKTTPRWVKRFVTEHETDLAPLSRREALKHL